MIEAMGDNHRMRSSSASIASDLTCESIV